MYVLWHTYSMPTKSKPKSESLAAGLRIRFGSRDRSHPRPSKTTTQNIGMALGGRSKQIAVTEFTAAIVWTVTVTGCCAPLS